jgi:hypothetical protein
MWGIIYIAENTIGFEQFGGTLAGHVATFTLFIMLVGMLTRLLMPSFKGQEYIIKDACDSSPAVHAPHGLRSLD